MEMFRVTRPIMRQVRFKAAEHRRSRGWGVLGPWSRRAAEVRQVCIERMEKKAVGWVWVRARQYRMESEQEEGDMPSYVVLKGKGLLFHFNLIK